MTPTSCRAYLLIELLLVLVLVSIMSLTAISHAPSWRWSATAHLWSQQMALTLAQVRQRALTDECDWFLCGNVGGSRCQEVWSGELLAYADRACHQSVRQNGTGLYLSPAIPVHWHVRWQGFGQGNGIHWLANGDAADSNGTLTLCPPQAVNAGLRQLVISKSGRIRIVVPSQEGPVALRSARSACGWR